MDNRPIGMEAPERDSRLHAIIALTRLRISENDNFRNASRITRQVNPAGCAAGFETFADVEKLGFTVVKLDFESVDFRIELGDTKL